jgi:hypothetical protein
MQLEIKTLPQQPAIAYIIELLFFKTKRRFFLKNSHANTGGEPFMPTQKQQSR